MGRRAGWLMKNLACPACCAFVMLSRAGWVEAGGNEYVICPPAEFELAQDRVPGAAWEDAAEFNLVLTGSGDEPVNTTTGRVMFDDKNFYLKVTAAAPEGLSRPRTLERNDRRVTREHDNLQVFITPESSPARYYRFAVDRAGNIWDTEHRRDDAPAGGSGWNPDWNLHVYDIPGGWAAEFIIPYSIFGVDRPAPGSLWRFKLGRYGEGLPLMMWPFNPPGAFHPMEHDGVVYFETDNLLRGWDFSHAPAGAVEVPHWGIKLPADASGEVKVIDDARASGGRALYYRKRSRGTELPRISSGEYRLEEGGAYELSAYARGNIRGLEMRMCTSVGGEPFTRSLSMRPSDEFRENLLRFLVPDGAGTVVIEFAPGADSRGEEVIDRVVLRQIILPFLLQ